MPRLSDEKVAHNPEPETGNEIFTYAICVPFYRLAKAMSSRHGRLLTRR